MKVLMDNRTKQPLRLRLRLKVRQQLMLIFSALLLVLVLVSFVTTFSLFEDPRTRSGRAGSATLPT
jgi:hypothetical protein